MNIEAAGALNIEGARSGVDRVKEFAQKSGTADFKAMLRGENPKEPFVIDKTDKLYEQCESLEVFFLKTLVSGMRKTVEKSELTDTGFAGEMYEDMLWDEYAKDFAKNAGFGFAELAYLELSGRRGQVIDRNA